MSFKTTSKIGVLLTNLGTPTAPTPAALRVYLREFLSDPYVVQIPKPIWWFILNGIVLRTRPLKSARLYQKIWTPLGSPLLVTSRIIQDKLKNEFIKRKLPVECVLGMRYGEPSLKQALLELKKANITEIIIFPFYPQYSSTTTASTYSEIKKQLRLLNFKSKLWIIDNYASHPIYIKTLAHTIQSQWQQTPPGEKILFSFHGIPQKHIKNGDPYYDQCITTAKAVVAELNISPQKWEIVFQSRFGREKWLQPYCTQVLQSLPKQNIKNIDIICPGFPVDCLETLEEIALTNKKIFLEAGGEIYNYIPALNDSTQHIELLTSLVLEKLGQFA